MFDASSDASLFSRRDGHLWAEDVSLAQIAKEVGTPTYIYAASGLRNRYQGLAQALSG